MDYSPIALTGNETLTGPDIGLTDTTVLHFWQWAFSDLRANSLRGIFAEWLVARLLGLNQQVRDPWAAWDLITPEGVTIEVKASAYLQSWSADRTSLISFGGLKGQTWSVQTGYSGVATYNADIYIFCVQIEKNPSKWDALDLTQWRFYVLPKEALAQRNYKTITLGALAALTPEMTRSELPGKTADLVKLLVDTRAREEG